MKKLKVHFFSINQIRIFFSANVNICIYFVRSQGQFSERFSQSFQHAIASLDEVSCLFYIKKVNVFLLYSVLLCTYVEDKYHQTWFH